MSSEKRRIAGRRVMFRRGRVVRCEGSICRQSCSSGSRLDAVGVDAGDSLPADNRRGASSLG